MKIRRRVGKIRHFSNQNNEIIYILYITVGNDNTPQYSVNAIIL